MSKLNETERQAILTPISDAHKKPFAKMLKISIWAVVILMFTPVVDYAAASSLTKSNESDKKLFKIVEKTYLLEGKDTRLEGNTVLPMEQYRLTGTSTNLRIVVTSERTYSPSGMLVYSCGLMLFGEDYKYLSRLKIAIPEAFTSPQVTDDPIDCRGFDAIALLNPNSTDLVAVMSYGPVAIGSPEIHSPEPSDHFAVILKFLTSNNGFSTLQVDNSCVKSQNNISTVAAIRLEASRCKVGLLTKPVNRLDFQPTY